MLSMVLETIDTFSTLELFDRRGVIRVNKCSDGYDTGDAAM